MGILACDRRGCQNVLCDHHSNEYGYLCNDCYAELYATGQNIEDFMNSTKGAPNALEKHQQRVELTFE